MLNFELIRVAIALIGTALAGWQDAKTSFIDDKIVFPMIALGLILDLATLNQQFILFSIGGAVVIGAIGYYLYRTGQLGGGDVLLFAGLQLLLPYAPLETAKMLGITTTILTNPVYLRVAEMLPFFFVLFVTASMLALVGSSVFYLKRIAEGGKLKIKGKELMLAGLVLLCLAFLFWIATTSQFSLAQLAIFAVVLACSVFTIVFKQEIMDSLVKQLKISQIEDEDILAIEKMDTKLVTKYGIEKVATKQNLEKLKKLEREEKIRLFPVYKDLPRLGPYILLALLAGVILANPVAYFLFL